MTALFFALIGMYMDVPHVTFAELAEFNENYAVP